MQKGPPFDFVQVCWHLFRGIRMFRKQARIIALRLNT